MGREDEVQPCSSSSSTDSNSNNNCSHLLPNSQSIASSSTSSFSSNSPRNNNGYYCCYNSKDLSTDLKLGLTISSLSSPFYLPSSPRGQYNDWPPIKPLLRNTLAGKSNTNSRHNNDSLFVKVYMQGIPIGRKLNLLAHHGYPSLISTLSHMFNTPILFQDLICHSSLEENHILTYEDKEGDWMMVGDVPWELFLTTVKRLKIVVLDKCQ
ncbi:hypothetical protein RND81_12G078400 [Saponaria officinalis]|uniref:Auxin-responsive protein n=1 Tax=Saponaria officinalis TaxID=3572 RepID=A0AAW1H7U9_SAPOF